MSTVTSRSKSRWKAALLAAASAAAATPMVSSAATGSMVVSLSLSPLGSSGYKSTEYIAPTGTDTIYVYATVTGSSTLSSSEIDGLQYLYYNVSQAFSNSSVGSITSATPNAALGFNGFANQSGSVNGSATSLAVGNTSTTTLTSIAKPKANNPVYSYNTSAGASASDGTNIVVNGSSVSFLVETLTYTPTFTPKPAVPGSADTVTFNVSVPAITSPYYAADYFTDLNSTTATGNGGGVGSANTFHTYSAGTGVTLIDGEQGDVNLDGYINGSDVAIIGSHFNTPTTGYTNGDLNGDGQVNGSDLALVGANFNVQYSTVTPSGVVAGSTAQIGGASVPEPASMTVLAGLASLGLMRRKRKA